MNLNLLDQVESLKANIVLKLLVKKDRKKLIVITLIQIALGVLDLVGVVLIGALGALSVQGIESHTPGNKVNTVLKILQLSTFSFRSQVAIIGLLASILLVSKTIFSAYFTRKTLFFLSRKSAEISSELVSKFLMQDLIEIQKISNLDLIYIASDGVKNLFVGILAQSITLISDFSMLSMITLALFLIDPIMTLFIFLLFLTVGYTLHRLLHVKATQIGREINNLTVENSEKLLEVLNSFREIAVRDRRQFYSGQIKEIRYKFGAIVAEQDFQPYISKYFIEGVSVFGALLLGGYEFKVRNAVSAVSVLALFLAATSRITPAVLRIQQGFLNIKNSSGASESTLFLLEKLKKESPEVQDATVRDFSYNDFKSEIILKNVNFKYPESSGFQLQDINIKIDAGTSLAIVGPSGAGKSSLADLILGVLRPNSGSVEVSGMAPDLASRRWPGAISYVPQSIFITSGSIRENVGQGFSTEIQTDNKIWEALSIAKLDDFVSTLGKGLDEKIGESGSKISGGQRQRLGIARALFTSPKVLCLDEATSALDGETEAALNKAIEKLSGKVTIIIIAHRLATVRMVDQIAYLEKGKILAIGSFEEIRSKIPNFDRQAKLMGL
jgi:ABC-type multidrug transport system fused ATPase/permease subunit